ncbi:MULTISPECIES: hypothetical protein [unclassified Sphingobium]|uniref:hypothetical protein n=1 Tax=unclassified Sphingobium TaxID=2611147 RepID=UPI002224CD1A|nr:MULTISPECIES: hypothetical protein [unclassified Sphingobium]
MKAVALQREAQALSAANSNSEHKAYNDQMAAVKLAQVEVILGTKTGNAAQIKAAIGNMTRRCRFLPMTNIKSCMGPLSN